MKKSRWGWRTTRPQEFDHEKDLPKRKRRRVAMTSLLTSTTTYVDVFDGTGWVVVKVEGGQVTGVSTGARSADAWDHMLAREPKGQVA